MKAANTSRATTTILYVDDESPARNYFMDTFGDDYEVIMASDVASAMEILEQASNDIDVIVTDYQMPGQNGADLIRHASTKYPDIVRVVATAHADKQVLMNSVNSGGVFHIFEKPLDPVAVKEALNSSKCQKQKLDIHYPADWAAENNKKLVKQSEKKITFSIRALDDKRYNSALTQALSTLKKAGYDVTACFQEWAMAKHTIESVLDMGSYLEERAKHLKDTSLSFPHLEKTTSDA